MNFNGYKIATGNAVKHTRISNVMHADTDTILKMPQRIVEAVFSVNHLVAFKHGCLFVDSKNNLFAITADNLTPIFKFECTDSTEIKSCCGLVLASESLIVYTNGGCLFFLRFDNLNLGASLILKLDLGSSKKSVIAAKENEGCIQCLIQSYQDLTGDGTTSFVFESVRVEWDGTQLNLGTYLCESPPYMATFDHTIDCFYICSEKPCRSESESVEVPLLNNPPANNMQNTYRWTQMGMSITIQVVLDQPLKKQQILCTFSAKSLKVNASLYPFPILIGSLYDFINPHDSTWTLEENRVLTIYLEKVNDTRWVSIFESDDGVLETLDAAVMDQYTKVLEKYTDSADAVKVLSVMTEQSEEIDFNSKNLVVTKVDCLKSNCAIIRRMQSYICPLLSQDGTSDHICIKDDVDARIVSINPDSLETEWNFPAFSYAKESKTDARLVVIAEKRFAFIVESKRYLYIYAYTTKNSSEYYVYDLMRCSSICSKDECVCGVTSGRIEGLQFIGDIVYVLKTDSIASIVMQF